MKILLVDDSISQRLVQKKALTDNGVDMSDIDEAVNGREALDKAKSGNYKLIVMDWNMPEMDGLTCLTELREGGINTPVLMITSEGTIAKQEEAKNAGVEHFLSKPINIKQFWSLASQFI